MKKTIILGIALIALAGTAMAKTAHHNLINAGIVYGNSPLCNAILKGDLPTVKKFVEYGADVNETTNGVTPLMMAARYNKVEIIKYLLEKGADKQIQDERGNTALNYAENSKSLEALEYLKQV